jgi:hypothetical protein
MEIYSTLIPVIYLQGGSSQLCILNLYDLFFRKKYKCSVPLMSCLLHIKERVFIIYFTVLCLYKNWIYTEEISYTYHDKPARLYHLNNIIEHTTHQYPAVEINENQTPDSRAHEIQNFQEAQKKIKELEKKIKDLEKRIPQRYPDVKYLNYRTRKRILVSFMVY